MSAYLNRMIQRFSPPASDDGATALRPFVRSRSPIAELDQRLGLDESFGHGLGDLAGGFVPPTLDSAAAPSPVSETAERPRVQRKLVRPVAAAPSLAAASPPIPAPAANLSSPPSQPARVVDRTLPPVELEARPAPMDPGQLFAPFARHHDDAQLLESREPAPGLADPKARTVELRPQANFPSRPHAPIESRTVEQIVEHRERSIVSPTVSPESTIPALAPRPGPALAPRPGPAVVASPSAPASTHALQAPWVAYERSDFVRPPAPSTSPTLVPRPSTRAQLERPPTIVVEPRVPAPAPFVADPGEAPAPVRPAKSVTPALSERAEATTKQAVASPPQQPQSPTRAKLDIESISRIGPLARHFPNRRRFRLRFR